MKIVIVNGSPKGRKSNTRVLSQLIQERFPEHDYVELPVATTIRVLESRKPKRDLFFDQMRQADIIIWSFPIYVFLIPSQLKRFIELIYEYGPEGQFKGKYSTSISTSLNFYDHTAHNYVRGVCEDFGMNYLDGFSASVLEMEGGTLKQDLLCLAEELFYHTRNRLPLDPTTQPISKNNFSYNPKKIAPRPQKGDKKIVVLTDTRGEDSNLNKMLEVFTGSVEMPAEIVNLHDFSIKGGCLGCGNCMVTPVCVYKDNFADIHNKKLLPADVIIYAGSIKDRYLSSAWKQYFDRGFVHGHRPILSGRPFGYLISGPLRQLPNLRQILEAIPQLGRSQLMGIVTDECADDQILTQKIMTFSDQIRQWIERPWKRPATFLGVGGHKILRDLVYGFRDFMVEDHKYYEEQGFYDFPNLEG